MLNLLFAILFALNITTTSTKNHTRTADLETNITTEEIWMGVEEDYGGF